MKLTQLSVFLENRPGRLLEACAAFGAAGVNFETVSLAQSGEAGAFGILRVLVKNPDAAFDALKDKLTIKKSEVLAVQIQDEAGELAKLLQLISQDGALNVEYLYGFTSKKRGVAAIVLCLNDVDKALTLLKSKGFALVGADDLFV